MSWPFRSSGVGSEHTSRRTGNGSQYKAQCCLGGHGIAISVGGLARLAIVVPQNRIFTGDQVTQTILQSANRFSHDPLILARPEGLEPTTHSLEVPGFPNDSNSRLA
jgi:hypothetical protein